jgi:hypothetical protein
LGVLYSSGAVEDAYGEFRGDDSQWKIKELGENIPH